MILVCVALWDDGDDLLAEQRAPYPHAREVLALRAADAHAGVLFASYARTAELQSWLERGWLREIAADRAAVRHAAPRVKVDGGLRLCAAARPGRPRGPSAARGVRHDASDLAAGAGAGPGAASGLPRGSGLPGVPRADAMRLLWRSDERAGRRVRRGGDCRASCAWCGRPQVDWECPICGSRRVRAPIVGAERTAEELGKAFPQTPVRQSIGGRRLDGVADGSAIVVATPGAEPPAEGGYAGAVLLDTPLLLLRQDLRAAEEALRRWLNVVALVRSGADGGSVIAVGESSGRALQALVRVDPGGFASARARVNEQPRDSHPRSR